MVAAVNRRFGVTISCENNCVNALGNEEDHDGVLNTTDWNYPFFSDNAQVVMNGTNSDTWDYYPLNQTDTKSKWIELPYTETSGLKQDSFNLNISHCLAEPLENICRMYLLSIEKREKEKSGSY
jgi:hypothetical protein